MILVLLTALKSPAAFHEQIKSLERARVRNFSFRRSPSLLLSCILKYLWASGTLTPKYIHRENAVHLQDRWFTELYILG